MRKETFTINEEIVDEIRVKDAKLKAMKDVVTTFMEMHLLDPEDTVMNSPVVLSYQAKITGAEVEFSKAKDELIHTYVEEDAIKNITSWNLDYSSCVLTVVFSK